MVLNRDVGRLGKRAEELIEFAIRLFELQLLHLSHVVSCVLCLLGYRFLAFLIGLQILLVAPRMVVAQAPISLAALIELHPGFELHHLVWLGVEGLHDLAMVLFARCSVLTRVDASFVACRPRVLPCGL